MNGKHLPYPEPELNYTDRGGDHDHPAPVPALKRHSAVSSGAPVTVSLVGMTVNRLPKLAGRTTPLAFRAFLPFDVAAGGHSLQTGLTHPLVIALRTVAVD